MAVTTTSAPPVDPQTTTDSRISILDQPVRARSLHLVAIVSSVLWLLAMLALVTQVAETADDPAAWDYVVATTDATGFLIVTVLAWVGSAVVRALHRI